MTYPTFDQYIKEDLQVYRCYDCGRTFTEATYRRMGETSCPCACGVQAGNLQLVDRFLNPEMADEESTTTWDRLVELVTDSGMWKCKECGFTAPEGGWDKEGFKDESFVTCPRCREVEGYEVLKIEEKP